MCSTLFYERTRKRSLVTTTGQLMDSAIIQLKKYVTPEVEIMTIQPGSMILQSPGGGGTENPGGGQGF